jgi:hypothetical protein
LRPLGWGLSVDLIVESTYVIVRTADLEVLPDVAVIVAVVLEFTADVSTVNVTEVFPARMVTDEGTVAEGSLLFKETASPPIGAGEPMVTVPVLDLPPSTDVGSSDTDLSAGAWIVRVALWETLFSVPVKVATV